MLRALLPCLWLLLVSVSTVRAQEEPAVYEHELDAPIAEVWAAFTTNEGLRSWVAPLVDIDLRIGGKWVSNYNAEGVLGDSTTIENTILSYEPERMLSLQATGFPADFPFVEAARNTWTVFYFSALSPTRTKIRVVGLGYTEDEQSQAMRSFFARANQYSLDQLSAALAGASAQGDE